MIALRLVRFAGGGAPSLAEARLMVTDKMAALSEAQLAAAATVPAGNSHKVATKVLQVFKKRVPCKQKHALKPAQIVAKGTLKVVRLEC